MDVEEKCTFFDIYYGISYFGHLDNMKIMPFILFLVVCSSAFSQIQHDDSVLIQKLQKYSDSTIVLQYRGFMVGPYLQILSKKGDTLTCYTYKDIVRKAHSNKVPNAMYTEMLGAAYEDYSNTHANINRFFVVQSVQPDSLIKLWTDISRLNLWKIKDDSVEGKGCPNAGVSIGHAMDVVLLLVTKSAIKELNFYGADDYERICPGRKGRHAVLKLSGYFRNTFK